MERKSIVAFIPILAILAIAIVFLSVFFNGLSAKKNDKTTTQEAQDLLKSMDDGSLMVYWIGDCPSIMMSLGESIQVVNIGNINDDTMPVNRTNYHIIQYNQQGDIVDEMIPRVDRDKTIIVINKEFHFSNEELEVIQNCIVQNNVPVLAIGSGAIKVLRYRLLMPQLEYSENDTFFYSVGINTQSHVIDESLVKEGKAEFAIAIANFINDYFDANGVNNTIATFVVATLDRSTTITEESTEVSVESEITEDTEY